MRHFGNFNHNKKRPEFLFDFEGSRNGINALSQSLTINGITVTNTFRHEGQDAIDGVTWDAVTGTNLPGLNSGGTGQHETPIHGNVKAFDFGTTNTRFQAASSGTYDITTEDLVLEFIFKLKSNGSNQAFIGKESSGNPGYLLFFNNGDSEMAMLIDASSSVIQQSGTLTEGLWYHSMVFMDRSGSGQWYINGVASGSPTVISAQAASITTAELATIGARTDGTIDNEGRLAYIAMWAQDAWLDTHLQATVAEERFARVSDTRAVIANDRIATTKTRTTQASVVREITPTIYNVFQVGSGWMRNVDHPSLGKGYLGEQASANSFLQSEDLSVTWTLNNGITNTSGPTPPNGVSSNNYAFAANAGTATKFISQDPGITHGTISAFVHLGTFTTPTNTEQDYIAIRPDITKNNWQNFNIRIGSLASSVGTIDAAGFEDWGAGWYRCWVQMSDNIGTVGFYAIDTNNVTDLQTSTGDGEGAAYFIFGMQAESGNILTSYIPTTTAAVIRHNDLLEYDIGSLSTQGSIVVEASANADAYADGYSRIVVEVTKSASDGYLDGYMNIMQFNDAASAPRMHVVASADNQAVFSDSSALDGYRHKHTLSYGSNDFAGFIDGESIGTDSVGAVPETLDRLAIGSRNTGEFPLGGVVHKIRGFDKKRSKERTPMFDFNPEVVRGGVDQLDAYMTINGVTVNPTFRYKGGDANANNWNPWIFGETLNFVEDGANQDYNQGSPIMGSGANDDSVTFNDGDVYQATNTTFADVTTEDMVFEMIYRPDDNSTSGIFAKQAGDAGYQAKRTSLTNMLVFTGGVNSNVNSGGEDAGTWNHVIWFLDRDGSGQVYVNGVASGAAADISARAATMTNAGIFTIGALSNTTVNVSAGIAYVAMWQRDDWLDTHLQASVAADRFAKVSGMYHSGKAPSTNTRTTQSTLTKNHGPNIFQHSEDLDNAIWIKSASSISDTSVKTPIGTISTTATLAENGSAATSHLIRQDAYMPAGPMTVSGYFKAATRIWVSIRSLTTTNTKTFFNLSTGTIGTTASNITKATITDAGGGWFRCSTTFTTVGGEEDIRFHIAEGDDDITFDGLSQDSIYTWGLQVEEGGFPTTYVRTKGVTGYQIFQVGDNWMRNIDSSALGSGFISELAITNEMLHSEDLSDVVWVTTNATKSSALDTTIPDGTTSTVIAIAEDDSAATSHVLQQTVPYPSGGTVTFSGFFKAINRNWIRLRNITAGGVQASFNLLDGTHPGSQPAGSLLRSSMEYYGNGWWRCSITGLAFGGDNAFGVNIADGDAVANISFDGLSQDSIFTWGWQTELGPLETSYIPTTTVAVTRNDDDLRYTIADGSDYNSAGSSMIVDSTTPNHNSATTGSFVQLIHTGEDTRVGLFVLGASSDEIDAVGRTVGVQDMSLPTVAATDGIRKTTSLSCGANDFEIYDSGVSTDSVDISAGFSSEYTRLDLGNFSGGSQPNSVMHRVRIFNKKRIKK